MRPTMALPVMVRKKMVQPGAASDGAAFNDTTSNDNAHHGVAMVAVYNGTAYISATASGAAFDYGSGDSRAYAVALLQPLLP